MVRVGWRCLAVCGDGAQPDDVGTDALDAGAGSSGREGRLMAGTACYGCGGAVRPGESRYAGLCETCADCGLAELWGAYNADCKVMPKQTGSSALALGLARVIRYSAREIVEEVRALREEVNEAMNGTREGLEAVHEGLAAVAGDDPGCGEG